MSKSTVRMMPIQCAEVALAHLRPDPKLGRERQHWLQLTSPPFPRAGRVTRVLVFIEGQAATAADTSCNALLYTASNLLDHRNVTCGALAGERGIAVEPGSYLQVSIRVQDLAGFAETLEVLRARALDLLCAEAVFKLQLTEDAA